MKINEIFDSIQGEGTYLGYPALFVRFQGCNLKCSFCDTPESIPRDNGNADGEIEVDELLLEISKYTVGAASNKIVVFTGGEPMLVKELPEIVKEVSKNNICLIETNGTLLPKDRWFGIDAVFSISPKKRAYQASHWYEYKHYLKLVLSGELAELNAEILDALPKDKLITYPEIFIQPCWPDGKMRAVGKFEKLVAQYPRVAFRMGLQAHKFWGVA